MDGTFRPVGINGVIETALYNFVFLMGDLKRVLFGTKTQAA